jgi:hypothetical protein
MADCLPIPLDVTVIKNVLGINRQGESQLDCGQLFSHGWQAQPFAQFPLQHLGIMAVV